MVLGRFDELGRGACIALVIVSFWIWWPLGLAALAFLKFGRSGLARCGGPGRWYKMSSDGNGRGTFGSGGGLGSGWGRWSDPTRAGASGHSAFDDYRAETLRRLEDEQREFVEYLERLRQARDKSEFDSFMSERRNRQTPQAPMPEA